MIIKICKSTQMASISGGDAGPGTGDPIDGIGNNYTWSLGIGEIEPNQKLQLIVQNTLAGVMAVVGGVAQTSCQSVSITGTGDYDGVTFSIGGSSELTVGQGQLQSHGSQIDLSSVNDPGFADISSLPVKVLAAAPDAGVTKWPLVIEISE